MCKLCGKGENRIQLPTMLFECILARKHSSEFWHLSSRETYFSKWCVVYFLKIMPLLISSYSLDKVPEVNNAFKMFFFFLMFQVTKRFSCTNGKVFVRSGVPVCSPWTEIRRRMGPKAAGWPVQSIRHKCHRKGFQHISWSHFLFWLSGVQLWLKHEHVQCLHRG